jgi:hypothetical protein
MHAHTSPHTPSHDLVDGAVVAVSVVAVFLEGYARVVTTEIYVAHSPHVRVYKASSRPGVRRQVNSSLHMYINNRQPYRSLSNVLRRPQT